LVVIPASNLILFFGIGLFALGKIPYINDVIGWCFNGLLIVLNKFIFWVDSLWFSLVDGISITMIEMIAWYVLILLLCWLTEARRTKLVLASLLIIFGLTSSYSYRQIENAKQKQIVVYSVPKQKGIAFIDGRRVFTEFDEKLSQNQSSILFHIKHHWWKCGVKEEPAVSSRNRFPFGKLILFEGKKVLLIDSALEKIDFPVEQKFQVDLLILSHTPIVDLENLNKLIDFNEVVFDSSNKKWKSVHWKTECTKMKIKYWDVIERGAYIKNLNEKII
jgi:uncharacterized membrane protein